jgi:hypothetical protein
MISLTLYGGGAFYVTPDSIDYVRELSPLEHEQGGIPPRPARLASEARSSSCAE